jgi:hypothetical protein
MKFLKLFTVLLFPTIFIMSCCCIRLMERWDGIKIQNNTDKIILVSAGCEKYGLFSYPDTTMPLSKPSLLSVFSKDYNYLRSSIKWEEIVNEQPEKKLSIYFFNSDTINFYEWSEIKKGYKIMKRIDLSVEELNVMNWTITYP